MAGREVEQSGDQPPARTGASRPAPRDEEIARLVGDAPAGPAMRAANQAIWLADAASRLAISALLILVVLVLLATLVSPWFWIAVAACVVFLIGTAMWFAGVRAVRTRKRLER